MLKSAGFFTWHATFREVAKVEAYDERRYRGVCLLSWNPGKYLQKMPQSSGSCRNC